MTKNIEKQTKSHPTSGMPLADPLGEQDRIPRPLVVKALDHRLGEATDRHHHRRAQLVYAVDGVIAVDTDRGLWVVPPQRAVWVPPGTAHQVRAVSTVATMHNLYLEPEAARDLPRDCCVVTVSPLMRELIRAAARLPERYDEDGPDGRLMAVILDQIRGLPVAPLHLPTVRDPRLRSIAEALTADPADARTLDDWAGEVGASSRTLARLFLRETGLTFGQWRQQARLLAALALLAEGTAVTTVALDLGYDSQSAFIAMFKKALGVTPGRYFAGETV